MQTKLTLRLDGDLINDAKNYAAREGRSVSELVAAYFKRLDVPILVSQSMSSEDEPISNARKSSFYGLLKNKHFDSHELDESAYRAHLIRKHQ